MCTAISFNLSSHLFGRTLDFEKSFGEEIVITPRNYKFSDMAVPTSHYALIGMAHIENNYPLYYDCANEKGLCMAGLNFVNNACYNKPLENSENVACHQLIPRILCTCATVTAAVDALHKIQLTDTPFVPELPSARLHWLIADKNSSVVVECVEEGLKIHNNPVGVLTNDPPFEYQLHRLNDFIGLTPKQPENTFAKALSLSCYSRGMGALGMPGDASSTSRFIRAAFALLNSPKFASKAENISQFFHIMETVSLVAGSVITEDGAIDITRYTSCIDGDEGVYYYTTYSKRQISAVRLKSENIEGSTLLRYQLKNDENIDYHN